MFWIVKNLWRIALAMSALAGVYFLPQDFLGAPEAAKPWKRILAMVDQNIALWAFSLVLFSWLVWSDARRVWVDSDFRQKFTKWRNGFEIEWTSPIASYPNFERDIAVKFVRNAPRVKIMCTVSRLVTYVDGTSRWISDHNKDLFSSPHSNGGQQFSCEAIKRTKDKPEIVIFFGKNFDLERGQSSVFRLQLFFNINGKQTICTQEVICHFDIGEITRMRLGCEPQITVS